MKTFLHDNYVLYHLNYSKENNNLPVLEKLGCPQRFGFPPLIDADANGVGPGDVQVNKGRLVEEVEKVER